MEIVEVVKIEDCMDGSGLYRCHLDSAWTSESVLALHNCGSLEYFPDFPRPFFRLKKPDGTQVKGVEGENTCLMLLPGHTQANKTYLKSVITGLPIQ